MSRSTLTFLPFACAYLAVCLVAAPCSANLVTFTATDAPGANPDASDGTNTFDVWSAAASTGDGNQAGNFLGDSGTNGFMDGAGAGASAWGLYANSGQSSSAVADISSFVIRDLAVAGDFISLSFDNGFIEGGGEVGIRFKDPLGGNASTFRFTNGTSNYRIDDDATSFDTGIGFTSAGFNVTLTLENSTGNYTLEAAGNTYGGRALAGAATSIASIEVFNSNAGGGSERNVFFNNLTISAIPEASPLIVLSLVSGVIGLVRRRRALLPAA